MKSTAVRRMVIAGLLGVRLATFGLARLMQTNLAAAAVGKFA